MNIFSHVLKKDCRRLALPFALWVLAMAVNSLLVLYREKIPSQGLPGNLLLGNLLVVGGLCGTVLYWVLTVILSAWIVLEDPPKGTSAFWLTRPFARGRVAMAKFFLLAVIAVMPAVANSAVLAVVGAGGRSLGLAALSHLLNTAFVPFAVAALAVTAESFGQFAINAILILIGAGLVAAATAAVTEAHRRSGHAPAMSSTLMTSRATADQLIALGIGFSIVLWRYLQRHARFVVAVVSIGALVPMLLPLYWRWDFLGELRRQNSLPPLLERNVHFIMHPGPPRSEASATSASGPGVFVPSVSGIIECPSDSSDNVIVPLRLSSMRLVWSEDESTPVGVSANVSVLPADQYRPAALAQAMAPSVILNLRRKPATIHVNFALNPSDVGGRLERESPEFHAGVSGSIRRYQIDGELPLTAGARGSWDRRDVRVDGVTVSEGRVEVSLREGFASSALANAMNPENVAETGHGAVIETTVATNDHVTYDHAMAYQPGMRVEPIYLLVNRSRREALLPASVTSQWNEFGGYEVMKHTMTFWAAPIDKTWLSQAVLVRVRFAEVGLAEGTVESDGVIFPLLRP